MADDTPPINPPETPPVVYDRATVALLAAYEAAQTDIRRLLVEKAYRPCQSMMQAWLAFSARFALGGEFAALAGQFAADSSVSILPEEIDTIFGAMHVLCATVEKVERRTGIFHLDLPPLPAPELGEEPGGVEEPAP